MSDNDEPSVSFVILAKEVGEAKTRLGLAREPARRVALYLAEHTVRTALDATSSSLVLVVTGDPEISRDATKLGAVVVPEGRPMGMNRAAVLGREYALRARPTSPVAILVADLPGLRPQHLDAAVDEFCQQHVPMYVADHHGEGTTLLIHGPLARPGFAFGLHSAQMHLRLGYAPARRASRGLRTDLDTPEDVYGMVSTRRWGTIQRADD